VTRPDRATNPIGMMGLAIARLRENEVIALVLEGVRAGRGGWVCPVNLDVLRRVVRDPRQRALVDRADVLTADGMPLIWASRLARTPLPERVSGSSLVKTLSAAAGDAGASVFLLGGDEGVAEVAAGELRRSSPRLAADSHCPPHGFEDQPAELAAIYGALERARPDIVFVGLGFPKQEHLIEHLRPRFPGAWFVSCGISFSFVSGDVKRAPLWAQRLGLEWLHRLVQEPRRLARRYLLEGIPFLGRLLAGALLERITTPSPRA
jgi:N-acetylglucosaminyldiphosphoundecaprenol N-acetyl-beta-D-mannosaminyltransferase